MTPCNRVMTRWVDAVTAVAQLSPAQADVVLGHDVMARIVDAVHDIHDRPYSGTELAEAADEILGNGAAL